MTEVFAGVVEVHYGFIDLYSDPDGSADEADDLVAARRGQANGLAGAQVPHQLGMVTGLHTGGLPLVVTWSETAPEVEDEWQDVVEVSVELTTPELTIATFDHAYGCEVPQAGWHRARYCASAMDEGQELDTLEDGETAPDRYLLQLWPAPQAPDAVLREGSETAAEWHAVARGEE
ncbi:hypothetical protein SAMN04489867_2669 [Pedococcus dokdonensis]|uniref:Uncharacterized protein n=1 Tax=Pedococcus dokdonensis TaxID=443156 RepID=A0A1H0T7A1_9MICO|nr:hypothetical protein [Pedococcus dokdonensis]SDP49917.1 hypothetical protein SAMN04489867_2669 [Pedococcus dokdonensis]